LWWASIRGIAVWPRSCAFSMTIRSRMRIIDPDQGHGPVRDLVSRGKFMSSVVVIWPDSPGPAQGELARSAEGTALAQSPRSGSERPE
jgi:hypothetical protein